MYTNLGNSLFNNLGLTATGPISNNDYYAIFELHELGHILGAFSDDSTSTQESLDNDATIIEKCFPQLIKK